MRILNSHVLGLCPYLENMPSPLAFSIYFGGNIAVLFHYFNIFQILICDHNDNTQNGFKNGHKTPTSQ